MNAEKVLGIAVCAFACATGSAFANTTNSWFDVTVTDVIVPHGCETNGAAVTVEGGKINLEDASLGINNFANAPTSDGIVKISATALLTPSSTNDFADVSDQSKAGFAVGIDDQDKTNFYGYANGVWHKLSGTPGDGETTFSMIINYRDTNVCFYVGNDLLDDGETSIFNLASGANGLNGINASGSGSITSVTGAYEVAVAIGKDNKRYGSTVEAVNTTGSGEIQFVDPTTGSAAVQQVAANGIKLWECDVLNVEPDATVALEPATKGVAGKIALKLAVDPDPGVSVKFNVKQGDSTVAGGPYDADAIGIPLTTGTYTIEPVITAAP